MDTKEIDPVVIRALDRLKKDWDALKTMDEKHNIDRLRLRADIAEGIRDVYKAGGTRAMMSEKLDISKPIITRMAQGNYNFGPATIHRKGRAQERLPILTYKEEEQRLVLEWARTEEAKVSVPQPEHYTKSGRDTPCKYCGRKAEFAVELELANGAEKTIFVCTKHQPPVKAG